jgi:hypothetical protein
MQAFSFKVLIAAFAATMWLPVAIAGERTAKIDRLISMHDLDTSVSVGNYYLKQVSLVSIRTFLRRVGREKRLGADWHSGNPWWQQAEQSVLVSMMDSIDREFSGLDWLRPQWADLYSGIFSDEEIDVLLKHFQTDVGRQQVQIIDHTVSTHVMMTLSFADKLKSVPGIENERAAMQRLWNDEDERMRFSIQDAANADGQAFALSPLGKKYFTTIVLNLTGIVNRRLDQVALQRQDEAEQYDEAVRPFVEGFLREAV